MYLRKYFSILLFLLAFSPVLEAQASELAFPGKAVGFIPHKALYQVQLENARSGTQIVNIAGQMYYEWDYDCDAWNSKHRFNVLYEYADSPTMRITSDFSNFESFDGVTLNYNAMRHQNGHLYEEIRGYAAAFPNNKGEAVYNAPKGLVQEIPAGTLYPMAHTLRVVEKIKAGEKLYNAVVFDGSDDEGPVEINAFIGKPVDGLKKLGDLSGKPVDKELLAGPAQHIHLAFFPISSEEENADYEMNLTLHHNSIISDMMIDYDDFSVSQKLIALEKIDQQETRQACE